MPHTLTDFSSTAVASINISAQQSRPQRQTTQNYILEKVRQQYQGKNKKKKRRYVKMNSFPPKFNNR